MQLETQFRLRNSPDLITYIRNNSHWYKLLNRNPLMINELERLVKEEKRIEKQTRFSKLIEYIDMFQSIVSNMK